MKEDGTNINEKGGKEIKLATEFKAKQTYFNLRTKTKQVQELQKGNDQLIMMIGKYIYEKVKREVDVVMLRKNVTFL